MGLATKAKGVPHWIQAHRGLAAIAMIYIACLAFGVWVVMEDPGTRSAIEAGPEGTEILFTLGLAFLTGSGTFTLLCLIAVAGLMGLGAAYTFVTQHLMPWVIEKSTVAGRVQARRRRRHMKKALADQKAVKQMQAAEASEAKKKAAHEDFLAAAETLYQALGVNVLEAYVEARVLKDQVVESTAKQVKL